MNRKYSVAFSRTPDGLPADADSRKASRQRGFTLVELVIVIAVVAILAGVGSVAYRGYIKRANEANDLSLLAAVNTAFQSACTEEGGNVRPTNAAAPLTDGVKGKKVNADGVTYGENIPLKSFSKYFKGNEDSEFKVYEALGYTPETLFYGLSDGGNTMTLANGWKGTTTKNEDGSTTYTFTDPDGNEYAYKVDDDGLQAFQDSNFGKNMTASGLMKEVNNVADAFSNFLKGLPQFASKFDLSKYGASELDESDPDYNKKLGNALVLAVADETVGGGFDAKALADKWRSNGRMSFTLNPGNLNATAAELALGYGLVTGFVNSEYGDQTCMIDGKSTTPKAYYQEQIATWGDKTGMQSYLAISNMMSSLTAAESYNQYYDSYGKKDVDAYVSALKAVNGNQSTLMNGNQVVKNKSGFGDEDLGQMLDAIFGKK